MTHTFCCTRKGFDHKFRIEFLTTHPTCSALSRDVLDSLAFFSKPVQVLLLVDFLEVCREAGLLLMSLQHLYEVRDEGIHPAQGENAADRWLPVSCLQFLAPYLSV